MPPQVQKLFKFFFLSFFSQEMNLSRKVCFLRLKVLSSMLAKVLALQLDLVDVIFSKICCRLMLTMSAVVLQK
jgi:hypothetical protein